MVRITLYCSMSIARRILFIWFILRRRAMVAAIANRNLNTRPNKKSGGLGLVKLLDRLISYLIVMRISERRRLLRSMSDSSNLKVNKLTQPLLNGVSMKFTMITNCHDFVEYRVEDAKNDIFTIMTVTNEKHRRMLFLDLRSKTGLRYRATMVRRYIELKDSVDLASLKPCSIGELAPMFNRYFGVSFVNESLLRKLTDLGERCFG